MRNRPSTGRSSSGGAPGLMLQPTEVLMPNNLQRFTLCRTAGGALLIRDNSDGSTVCFVRQGRRDPIKTHAMVTVMLDALNNAIKPKTAV